MPAPERFDPHTAGRRRQVPDLGPHRDRDHWCATGSPGLPHRGSSCQQRAWPRAGRRGTDRFARRHRRRAGASSDGDSRAAARSRKPASRLTESGGPPCRRSTPISGRPQREECYTRKNKSALPVKQGRTIPPPRKSGLPPIVGGRPLASAPVRPTPLAAISRRRWPVSKNPDELSLPRLAVPDKDVTAGS
jgi:hypothetical protein